ncbi:putative enoyl-CoA hydratase 2, mitochondrial [Vitis vinifera]|uniref:Putative enoyl-CoA hydratase 2, mitochondrial n=1 Tax=Vitis vinifera TaxID=29760 RepID=A0A438GD60_VITVI|nr:putative enoyl-CoA hydratase 2, mitochondrial [Vitis vinifera]
MILWSLFVYLGVYGEILTSAGTVSETVEGVRVVAYVHNSKTKEKNVRNYSFDYHYQSCRTLILQSTFESVRVQRLSHDDSGIVEVHLDQLETKNAIGKKMLRGLQNIFEAINRDVSANVVMLSSSTPRALHVPTIVVIKGEALGGGLEMALSCDLHICGEDENTQLIVMFQHQTDQKYCIKVGTWFHLELVMQPTEKNIRNKIPSCNDYVPTLTCGSISVKVGNSISRENYLKGYTFLLEPAHKYNFGDRLQSLMESSGAKVDSIDGLSSSSQGLEKKIK